MFTLNRIKEAHAKVKNGADFPQYIQNLITMGVLEYTVSVINGRTQYKGKDNYNVVSDAEYPILKVARTIDADKFILYLKKHQQGETDYFTFCKHSAETGVEKWIVNLIAKTCTYYGKANTFILKEDILI